ncbi:unnamed protein product [Closterium sp. Naga37s-1]|nr:unnamed protein product [Closterium sp. Naga37s-1]
MEVTMPLCGHKQTVKFGEATATTSNSNPSSAPLAARFMSALLPFPSQTSQCGRVMAEVTMPLCGHKQTVKCGEAATRVTKPELCTARCGVVLSDSCGNTCISPCGQCIVAPAVTTDQGQGSQQQQPQQRQQQQLERNHKKCTQPCKRPHPCAHLCPDPCHSGTPCKPCTRKCLVACQHSSCPQPCHRTCAPCAEPCGWHCKHQGRCSLPCGAPCDRLPCEQRCEKRLECGHQCPSLCSEKCPPKAYCAVAGCGAKEKREMRVDLVTLETLGEIDPDESPVLVLPCGHAYTVETLDGHLGLNQVYQEAEAGSAGGGSSAAGGAAGGGLEAAATAPKWVAVRPFDDGGLSALKGCPECRQPITGLRRYGRMVNKALLDESERKFALSCLADQQQLQQKLSKLSQAISACPEAAQSWHVQQLARAATFLIMQASNVRDTAMEPPTQQTYQASVAALQRKHLQLGGSSSRADADSPAWEEECHLLYVPPPDPRPLCEALMLLGKAFQLLMASNFLALRCLLKELQNLVPQNARPNARPKAGQSAGQTDKNSTDRAAFLAGWVENCRAVVLMGLRNAEKHVGEAVEWAGKRRAHRLEAKGRLELADLFRAFVEGMMAERLLATSPAGLDESRKQQLEYLERAKMQCLMVASHHLASDALMDALLSLGATTCSIEDANTGTEAEQEVWGVGGWERGRGSTFALLTLPLTTFALLTLPLTTFALLTLPLTTFALLTLPLTTFALLTLPLTTFALLTLPLTTFALLTLPLTNFALLLTHRSSLPPLHYSHAHAYMHALTLP